VIVSYIGLIKKNSQESKVLVLSKAGRYYVWTALHEKVDSIRIAGGGEVPNLELEIATERQVDIGRGNMWVPNASQVMFQVEFHGIVSGGQVNKRVLVKLSGVWSTVVVPAEVANGATVGDMITVDQRLISPARGDQISAGLGDGTLRRVRRGGGCKVSVS